MNDPDDALIMSYLLGDISDDDLAKLDHRLRSDKRLAVRFARTCAHETRLSSILRLCERSRQFTTLTGRHQPIRRLRHDRRRWRESNMRFLLPLAAAATVALTCWLGWQQLTAPSTSSQVATEGVEPTLATVDLSNGQVSSQSRSGSRSLDNGAAVRNGDYVMVGETGRAVLLYSDGTRLELASGATVRLSSDTGQHLELKAGRIDLEVAPQLAGRPFRVTTAHAKAVIVGTKLQIALDGNATLLRVSEGAVRFHRETDGREVIVPRGCEATASSDAREVLQAVPSANRPLLPPESRLLYRADMADRPAEWVGSFSKEAGSAVVGSVQRQHNSPFFGEVSTPWIADGLAIDAQTYLYLRYRTEGFLPTSALKIQCKKSDRTNFAAFFKPEPNDWNELTVRLDSSFVWLADPAKEKRLSPGQRLHLFSVIGVSMDGAMPINGRLWLSDLLIFSTNSPIPVHASLP